MNEAIFTAINNLAGKNNLLDFFGIFLAEYTPYVAIGALIYFWFKDCFHPSFNKNCLWLFKNNIYQKIVLLAGVSAILGIVVNRIISAIYFHPRPFMQDLGTLLVKHSAESSFPSDHTTFILSIAFSLFYFSLTKKAGAFLIILGIFSGISRVFCGLHFPADILGSIAIAILSASIPKLVVSIDK